jgi:hypothetical protein
LGHFVSRHRENAENGIVPQPGAAAIIGMPAAARKMLDF